jgi:cytosine/adenosine deaminase-related metal-dependent hydrolase
MKCKARILVLLLVFALAAWAANFLAAENKGVEHGRRYDRLVIRNVIVVDGKGTPPRGPLDVIVENNKIAAIRGPNRRPGASENEAHVIDGTGMYLLPGLINNHVHLQDSRAGIAQPFEYSYKLWLACGITTVRDVGSDARKTVEEKKKSLDGTIAAPRIYLYMTAAGTTPAEVKARVAELKKLGADGIKIFGMDRDIMKAAVEESRRLGLRVAHHVGVEETDAWDDAGFGVSTMEHWYGIPDAALDGSQNFPPSYNYSNEVDRFRYAGRLWREANPDKLKKVLQTMIGNGVGWIPTFGIYEANRDLVRAMNQPWFKDYLHPALEAYFTPNPANHGSYHWNWSTEDEIYWKENYRLWMAAVRDFARMGGLVGCGEDAGFIYMTYGFTYLRELELMQEAGFHPIDVIQNATGNNARILGLEDSLGRVREGFLADLILVGENPLANFKYLYPTGVLDLKDGRPFLRGGVEWTIKDGIVYHAPELLEDVKSMVARARAGKR